MANTDIYVPWDGWKVVNKIGHGTYGVVYEIERTLFSVTEKAAMKVIRIPRDENDLEMLYLSSGYDEGMIEKSLEDELRRVEREYALMSEMRGVSNIVSCDDFAYRKNDSGVGYTIYIRMQLLRSLNLEIKEKRNNGEAMTEDEVIKIGMDICRALTVCEKCDVIHRDIKPQNIMLSSLGDYKIGDFGTARSFDHSTQATMAGTVSFMAPEVFRRERYGRTVDIYSLGMVLYWLMNSYRMPFVPGDTVPSRIVLDEADSKRMTGEQLPAPCNAGAELSRIILKACAFRSDDRYSSAGEMLEELTALQKGISRIETLQDEDLPDDEKTVALPDDNDGAADEVQMLIPEEEPDYMDLEETLPMFHEYDPSVPHGRKHRAYGEAETDDGSAEENTEKWMIFDRPYTLEEFAGLKERYGDEVEKHVDFARIAQVYMQLAMNGDTIAQYNLGMLYKEGLGVEEDDARAAEWFSEAAAGDLADAQYRFALSIIDEDPKGAVEDLESAANKGFVQAQCVLGDLYRDGNGVAQNYRKAAEWYSRAAESGDYYAQCELGELYEKGRGVRKDLLQAIELYSLSADQNWEFAQIALGDIYSSDWEGQDYRKAADYYIEALNNAADNEYAVGAASYGLGRLYESGKGVNRDMRKAVEMYRRAAELNNEEAAERLEELMQKRGK